MAMTIDYREQVQLGKDKVSGNMTMRDVRSARFKDTDPL